MENDSKATTGNPKAGRLKLERKPWRDDYARADFIRDLEKVTEPKAPPEPREQDSPESA
jgi:hypothetical protein